MTTEQKQKAFDLLTERKGEFANHQELGIVLDYLKESQPVLYDKFLIIVDKAYHELAVDIVLDKRQCKINFEEE